MYIVDLRESFSIPLVELFYKEVMEAMFPVDDERDTLQFFIDGLGPHGPGLGEQEELHVILAFGNPDPKSGDSASQYQVVPYDRVPPAAKLAGAVCFEYYVVPNVSILTYVATLPGFRGRGIGGLFSRLVEEYSNEAAHGFYDKTTTCHAILAETHDHEIEDNVMDSQVRHRVLYGWGFRQIWFPYMQPPVSQGGQCATNLLLVAKLIPRADGKPTSYPPNTFPSDLLRQFLEAFFPDDEYNTAEGIQYYKSAMRLLAKSPYLALSPTLPWKPYQSDSQFIR